jgi:hypothetical protein
MPISKNTLVQLQSKIEQLQRLNINRNTPADANLLRDHLVSIRIDILTLAHAIAAVQSSDTA